MTDANPEAAEPKTYAVIETRDEYLEAVALIAAGEGPVAVDAERASGYRYSQRAYLIQVFRRGAGTFLFDPPAIGAMTELNEAIQDLEWVFHAASQDLDCLKEVGLVPQRIFDTELGARLAGLPRVGLGTVVESLLGIHLAKEHSAADWSTRPLPASWLLYAALDVELLPDLRDAVAKLLEEQGKTEIASQEFADVLTRPARPSSRGEGWRRLSGVHSVRGGRNLAVAKALWEARDAYAREIDTAPGRLVPDSSLVAAAKAPPSSKKELAAIKEFVGRASRTELSRWWAAIETGLASEELPTLRVPGGDSVPPPKAWADRNPNADERLKLVRPRIVDLAEELQLPVENLLTPDTLRRVSWSPPEPLSAEGLAHALASHGARQWQIEATVQIIHQAFVEAAQSASERDNAAS
ncbi:MAG: ribonuclease D [Salinibacterium sp.]|nr:ribonuclease D [Salinibacterium sp.]MBF0671148.1 ribonuclease D [Salinibacterium sp.]